MNIYEKRHMYSHWMVSIQWAIVQCWYTHHTLPFQISQTVLACWTCNFCIGQSSWEPEGCYQYWRTFHWELEGCYQYWRTFHWEPEGCYHHRFCTVITPFWFSQRNIFEYWMIVPFRLSTDDVMINLIFKKHGFIDVFSYRKTSSRGAYMDMILFEVFLKNIHLIPQKQIVQWHYL